MAEPRSLNAGAKITLFVVALLAVFTVGVGIGKLVGGGDTETTETAAASHDEHAAMSSTPAGLAVATDGYELSPITAPGTAGEAGQLEFTITGPDGAPVTDFDTLHEKELHLIVVRADTGEYRHVHPTMAADGTWSIDWTWPSGGSYRVFADFDPSGESTQLTLGRWFEVAGQYDPAPLPQRVRTAEIDGYTVELAGDLTTRGGMLEFTVSRDGQPVTTLQPYLGANGHLVALRVGDLAYLHVHPEDDGGSGPVIAFHAQAPTSGTYRLFLDFQVDDVVRTAEFTIDATSSEAAPMDHGGGHG